MAKRFFLGLTIVTLLLAVLVTAIVFHNSQDEQAAPAVVPIGGNFQLLNHRGEEVTQGTFLGGYMLMYFGFTFCPDICPTSLQIISSAYRALPDRTQRQVDMVFVSVDPERDSVTVLKDYVSLFDKDLIGLTGTPDQVAQTAKVFGIYFKKAANIDSAAGYLVDHSTIIYLIGPDGRYIQHFKHDVDPKTLAAAIKKIVDGG